MADPADAERATARRSPAGRLLVLLAVGLLPWSVLVWDGGVDFVFAAGLVNGAPPRFVAVTDYLFRYTGGPAALPRRLLAWPTSVLLYAVAVASAAGGVVLDREDRRVTGGLLVLAGLSHLWFAVGLARPGLLALPVGTAATWAVAWWAYGSDLERAVGLRRSTGADE